MHEMAAAAHAEEIGKFAGDDEQARGAVGAAPFERLDRFVAVERLLSSLSRVIGTYPLTSDAYLKLHGVSKSRHDKDAA